MEPVENINMADRSEESWLSNKIISAIRKMKIDGITQALEPGITWIERIVWLWAFFVCLGIAGYITMLTINDHSENPVLNSFREDESISKFPSPAVTITGTTVLNNNAKQDVEELLEKESYGMDQEGNSFEFKGLTWNPRLIDILLFTMDHMCEVSRSFATKEKILDPQKMQNIRMRDIPLYAKHLNVTLRDNTNDTALMNTVLPFLKDRTLDCKKIIAACRWEGNHTNCMDVFVATQTDVGNGCTFNRIPDKLLRRKQGIISAFQDHNFTKEEMKDWKQFDLDSIISVEGMKRPHTFRNPKGQHEAGMLTGLSVMLIFDDDEGKSCPIVDASGFLIGIHSPFEEPRILQTGITVPPRTEVFIKVRTEATVADESIRSLSIDQRKCYFQSENPLRNFRYYTVNNCHQECFAKEIQNKCKCLLLTQSIGENEVLCGPADVECVENATVSIRKEGFDRFCRDPICYSPCTELKWDPDATYLPYVKGNFFDFTSHEFLKQNHVTSIAHIAQASNSVPVRERKLRYSFSVLFGVIGGTWSMIFGFTFFTIINMLAGFVALVVPIVWEIDVDDNHHEDAQTESGTILAMKESAPSDAIDQRIAVASGTERPRDNIALTCDSCNKFFTDMTRSVSTQTDSHSEGNMKNPTTVVSISGAIVESKDLEGSVTEVQSMNQGNPISWGNVWFSRRKLGKWNAKSNQAHGLASETTVAASAEEMSLEENP